MSKLFVSSFVPFVFGCVGYSSFPPFEVLVCPGEYHLVEARAKQIVLDGVDLRKLRERIDTTYGGLYNDGQSGLSRKDLEEIVSNYGRLVSLEKNSNLLSFRFDYAGYYSLFKFDRKLLSRAFAVGCLPFLFDYTWELAFQGPKGSDRLVHEVAFSQFFGGNIVPKATETDKFQHIQPEYSAGQMFIEQQVNH